MFFTEFVNAQQTADTLKTFSKIFSATSLYSAQRKDSLSFLFIFQCKNVKNCSKKKFSLFIGTQNSLFKQKPDKFYNANFQEFLSS